MSGVPLWRAQVAELTYYLLKNARNNTFIMTKRCGSDGLPGIEVALLPFFFITFEPRLRSHFSPSSLSLSSLD